jgi:23S rRNA (guanine2445-N2)-methyltransferase / 23S rRNA (guanine2069-N7)-methyltransferase
MNLQSFFATAPKGIESVLKEELEILGAQNISDSRAGVGFQGDMELAYRACLWLRTANRVLMPIFEFTVENETDLYQGVQQINWADHVSPDGTLVVDLNSSQSVITNSHYGALKVKDAIVDQFREKTGIRPSVERLTPDIRVNVYLLKKAATISIDLSGESLHKRGYRTSTVAAPMKENLAAAILLKGGWPEIAKNGGGLIDPMCGSGTLPIEAALIASETAPGLFRSYFGFLGWKRHQADIWSRLIAEAEQLSKDGLQRSTPVVGYDLAAKAITASVKNSENAGLEKLIHFEKRDLSGSLPTARLATSKGLVVINPPYGERIGEVHELKELYRNLGNHLYHNFKGWKALLFTGNEELSRELGFGPKKTNTMYNGSIKCKLFTYDLKQDWGQKDPKDTKPLPPAPPLSEEAQMFSNRIKKNRKRLKKWINKNNLTCYRIYDKDIPEYAAAVDVYEKWLHVQEYKAPESVDASKAKVRVNEMMQALASEFQVPIGNIFHKVRRRQKGSNQYQKLDTKDNLFQVNENGNRFLVNLSDYLDTGLFLDHRSIREFIGENSGGKHFLNLFAYTGSATVYAAKNGAKSTTSVDVSNRYLDWARQNLEVNGLMANHHQLVQKDCFNWIRSESGKFDLIFLNPPTFSNIKKQNFTFDVQHDHVELIRLTAKLLGKNGLIIFSTNYRKFKMESAALPGLLVENISQKTIPTDFSRSKNIHNCWMIQKKR